MRRCAERASVTVGDLAKMLFECDQEKQVRVVSMPGGSGKMPVSIYEEDGVVWIDVETDYEA